MTSKRIIFFDGDGTLWYPQATKRSRKPFWVYLDEATRHQYLDHLILTPTAIESLQDIRARGISTVLLSTHPHEPEEAALVLQEKVAHFKLSELFDEVHATTEQPEAKGHKILEILARLGLSPNQALMVGDSYRWDYLPARLSGVEAILIDSDYHQEKLAEEPAELLITELSEILPLLN